MNIKTFIVLFVTLMPFCVRAQTSDSLEIATLKAKVANLERQIGLTNRQIQILNDEQNAKIDSLNNLLSEQTRKTESMETAFSQEIGKTNSDLNANVESLNQTISANKLFAIVGIVIAVLLLVAVGLILWKKIKNKDSAIDQIKSAQKSLESVQKSMQEESIKLDGKLVELLEKQMSAQPVQNEKTGEQDHSFALKVGDEIAKIETNLSKMDPEVKGYKQLKQALKRIKDNFNAHGYEIVELLGQDYNDGMPFEARFVPDDTLPEGKRIISGITRLQINYKGEMIQAAKIVVRENI